MNHLVRVNHTNLTEIRNWKKGLPFCLSTAPLVQLDKNSSNVSQHITILYYTVTCHIMQIKKTLVITILTDADHKPYAIKRPNWQSWQFLHV